MNVRFTSQKVLAAWGEATVYDRGQLTPTTRRPRQVPCDFPPAKTPVKKIFDPGSLEDTNHNDYASPWASGKPRRHNSPHHGRTAPTISSFVLLFLEFYKGYVIVVVVVVFLKFSGLRFMNKGTFFSLFFSYIIEANNIISCFVACVPYLYF